MSTAHHIVHRRQSTISQFEFALYHLHSIALVMNFSSSQSLLSSYCLLQLLTAAMILLIGCCPPCCLSRPLFPIELRPIESFDTNCGANAYWTPHGTYCPPNCANRGVPGPCIKLFVPSCQCLPGFVFTGDNRTGDCVRLADCATEQQQQQH